MSDGVALAAIVILLFPMGYFFLASPAFLLVKIDITEVARLLRLSRSGRAAGFCRRGMPSLMPGMPAMPVRCEGCAGCIGAACCATRSSLPSSWAAFPMWRPRRRSPVRYRGSVRTLHVHL